MVKEKQKKEKTLRQIKKGVQEAEEDKEEVVKAASEYDAPPKKTGWGLGIVLLLICAVIIALGVIERNRVIATTGGVAFIIVILYVTGKYMLTK